MSRFNRETRGAEIVASFPEKVEGRTFAITGPSEGGLGAQTALDLAAGKPAAIILLGRTQSKITSVIAKIQEISPSTKVYFVSLDLASINSIRAAANTINNGLVEKLDVLINNAGIMATPDYTTTDFGVELQFGSNHIGHFLLTNLLVPKLEAAGKGARVVNVTSDAHLVSGVRFDDYNFQDGKNYDKWVAYAQSKTANILFAIALAKRLAPKGIHAYSSHPGAIWTGLATHVPQEEWAIVGKMYEEKGIPFNLQFKEMTQGSSSALYAALDPSLENQSGSYIADSAVGTTPEHAHDPELAEKLWMLSEEIVGQKFTF